MNVVKGFFALFVLLFSGVVQAGTTITLDASSSLFSNTPAAQGTSIRNDVAARIGSMSAMVNTWKLSKGPFFNVPQGTVFKFIWTDKSSEKGLVINNSSTVGVEPIPGTQSMPSGGGVGYTTDQFGNSLGGVGVIGFTPIYSSSTVCVGDYCETASVIIGYQYEYRPGSEYLGNAQV